MNVLVLLTASDKRRGSKKVASDKKVEANKLGLHK